MPATAVRQHSPNNLCRRSAAPFDRAGLEERLIEDAYRRSTAFQLQDARCTACRRTRAGALRRTCACGSGRFELAVPPEEFLAQTRSFGAIAAAFGFKALAEVVRSLGFEMPAVS